MKARDPKYLGIAYLPNGAFVLPILGQLQRSTNPRVKALASRWVDEGLGTLASSLSTKVSILSLLTQRLTRSTTPLAIDIVQDPRAREAFVEGKAWAPRNRQLPFQVLLDVDSFIFEFRSAYEILGKFLVRFFEVILGQRISETAIKNKLREAGVDMAWADDLQTHRKVFFHEQAPWLAIEILDPTQFGAELLILSHAGADPEDPASVIPFVRLSAIYAGMDASLRHLAEWLSSEISTLESSI